jgi:hypothetical protein
VIIRKSEIKNPVIIKMDNSITGFIRILDPDCNNDRTLGIQKLDF